MSAKALLNTTPHPTAEQARGRDDRQHLPLLRLTTTTSTRSSRAGRAADQACRGDAALRIGASRRHVGHATHRIDAVERTTGKATYTGDVKLPGMLYARVSCEARIRTHASVRIDASKALALPGVKAVISHDNCTVLWGAGSISGGAQYNDEIKKITKAPPLRVQQPRAVRRRAGGRRRSGRSSHGRRGAAADRGRLRAAAVRPRSRGGAQARRPQIWPEGNLSPNARNETMPIGAKRGNVEEGFAAADHVFEDRYSTSFVHNAQMEPRVVRRGLGGRQAHRLHADRRRRQLPHRHGARSRHPAGKGPRRLPLHGRQLRQQEPEPGRRSDRRDAGEGTPARR